MNLAVVDEAGGILAQRFDFSYVHSRKSSYDKHLGQKSCRGLFFYQNVSNDKFHESVESFVAHDNIVFGAQRRDYKRGDALVDESGEDCATFLVENAFDAPLFEDIAQHAVLFLLHQSVDALHAAAVEFEP